MIDWSKIDPGQRIRPLTAVDVERISAIGVSQQAPYRWTPACRSCGHVGELNSRMQCAACGSDEVSQ